MKLMSFLDIKLPLEVSPGAARRDWSGLFGGSFLRFGPGTGPGPAWGARGEFFEGAKGACWQKGLLRVVDISRVYTRVYNV